MWQNESNRSKNSRSGAIGTISPNYASLVIREPLSLHLLLAIDLECPSLEGDFSLSRVLNASLSSFVCLSRARLPLLRLACILTKCA